MARNIDDCRKKSGKSNKYTGRRNVPISARIRTLFIMAGIFICGIKVGMEIQQNIDNKVAIETTVDDSKDNQKTNVHLTEAQVEAMQMVEEAMEAAEIEKSAQEGMAIKASEAAAVVKAIDAAQESISAERQAEVESRMHSPNR